MSRIQSTNDYEPTSSNKRRRTSAAREGGPPPSGPPPEVELVTLNGDLITTIKRDELEDVTIDGLRPPPSGRLSGLPPPPSGLPPEVELVTMNGDLITTVRGEELEGVTVDMFLRDLEHGMVRGAPEAKTDDLCVMLERFSLVIGSEVMECSDDFDKCHKITDYFHEGGPTRITLVKHPVEEAIVKELRRQVEYTDEHGGFGPGFWTIWHG